MIVFDFIQKYYIEPIIYGTGYNIYNTLTYAIALMLSAYFVFRVLKKIGIEINKKFIIGVFPYIILGGILRALQDAEILKSFIFVTPLIYFAVFSIAFIALLLSKIIETKIKTDYYKIWFSAGILFCIFGIINTMIVNYFAFLMIVGISFLWAFIFLFIKKISFAKKQKNIVKFLSSENLLIITTHMFDATTTFVALQFFNYFEQHVVPSIFINIFGPVSMYLIKLFVVIPVLFFIDRDLGKNKDMEKRNFIKMIITMLGLAPGIRNFLRLVMGV